MAGGSVNVQTRDCEGDGAVCAAKDFADAAANRSAFEAGNDAASDKRELAIDLLKSLLVIERGPARQMGEVSKGEMALLGILLDEEGGLAPSDLSRRLSVSTSRIANTLNSLERKGFVERIPNPDDRRGIEVIITPAGARFAQDGFEQAVDGLEELLCALDDSEAAELVRITHRVEEMVVRRKGMES